MKRRILTLVLALCLVVALLPAGALAADKPSYVALGDSIAAGYGLEGFAGLFSNPDGCFPALVAARLGYDLTNLAVSGDDTTDLLEAMETAQYADAIQGADVLSLTIGSNDILVKTISKVMEHYQLTGLNEAELEAAVRGKMLSGDMQQSLAVFQEISDYFASEEFTTMLDAAMVTFQANWDTLMETLQAWNPDAAVVVTNYYNPYAAFNFKFGELNIQIGSLGQHYLDQLNAYITASPYNGTFYTIVDVTKVTTNVKLDVSALAGAFLGGETPDLAGSMNLDPHPDAAGHAYIAGQLVAVLAADPTAAAGLSFADVPQDAWYAQPVAYASAQNLVVGDDAGNFSPDANMTIAQYMTVLYRYARAAAGAGIPEKATTGQSWLEAASWINDHLLDGRFTDLTAAMTRNQMSVITEKVLKAVSTLTGKALNTRTTHGFTDVAQDSEYFASVAYLESVYGIDGIAQEDGTYLFEGASNITRAQVAQVLYNIMTKSAA